MAAHRWPGNVRELENLVERLAVLCPHDVVEAEDLPVELRLRDFVDVAARTPGGDALSVACDQFERVLIVNAITRAKGNRAAAARDLGLPYSTFAYRLEHHGLG
jgi:DNA-binding NtrC family response regulator